MYLKRSQRHSPTSFRPEGRPYFVTPMSSRGCLLLFCFFFLISSCYMAEEPDWRPPHPVTVPYTCESADYFIRIGEEEIGSVFFIGDSTKSFYSFLNNEIYKYGMPGLEVKKSKSLPSTQMATNFCPRDQNSGWLFTARDEGNSVANVIDTALNIIYKRDIGLYPGADSHVTATVDKGFAIAANLYETDKYSVLRYSETGSLMWRTDVVPRQR